MLRLLGHDAEKEVTVKDVEDSPAASRYMAGKEFIVTYM